MGKSSLLNKLVNRKAIARVSATPGKTATINFYRLEGCRLVDLPGYGYAKVSQKEKERWAKLVEGYFAQQRQIALVIQLLDMRHKPTEDDRTMLRFLEESGLPYAVVCTKSDKLNKSETAAQTALFQELLGQRGVAFVSPFPPPRGRAFWRFGSTSPRRWRVLPKSKGNRKDDGYDLTLPQREPAGPFGYQRVRYGGPGPAVRHPALCDE